MNLPAGELRQALESELRYRMLETYRPYARQREFHAAGARYGERCFLAGNQLGKTRAGGMEVAMHLTGLYPEWWEGRRWDRPVVAWAGSNTGETTRDTIERTIAGRVGVRGTGTIPATMIADMTAGRSAADSLAAIYVRHKRGGTSILLFKSFEQGRTKWQGDTVDLVWLDEEPDEEIYEEAATRLNATKGSLLLTCTPLLGMTKVVTLFYPRPTTGSRHLTMMTIDDVEHYTKAERDEIVAKYAPHLREARAMGIPALGDGRVFPFTESMLREPPIEMPRHWPRIAGIDFGHGDHPTAAAWLAWDREADVVHLYDAYSNEEPGIAIHSDAIKARGKWIPVAWPHDGLQNDRVSSQTVAGHYRDRGVNLLPEHAQHEGGGIGVEAGILEMFERMQQGRFKVAEHLGEFWREFRIYRRDKGKIVKEHDDLISAVRYGLMSLRFARVAPDDRLRQPIRQAAWDPYNTAA